MMFVSFFVSYRYSKSHLPGGGRPPRVTLQHSTTLTQLSSPHLSFFLCIIFLSCVPGPTHCIGYQQSSTVLTALVVDSKEAIRLSVINRELWDNVFVHASTVHIADIINPGPCKVPSINCDIITTGHAIRRLDKCMKSVALLLIPASKRRGMPP